MRHSGPSGPSKLPTVWNVDGWRWMSISWQNLLATDDITASLIDYLTIFCLYRLLSSCTIIFFMVFPSRSSFGLRPLTSSLLSRDSQWHHPWSAEVSSPTKPWRTAQMGFLAVEAARCLVSNGHVESVATPTLEASARRWNICRPNNTKKDTENCTN